MIKNQKGAVDIYLIVALILVVGVGIFAFSRLQEADETVSNNEAASTNSVVVSEAKDSTELVPATDCSVSYTYSYPSDWFVSDECVTLTSYDPSRDSSDFSSAELHFGLEGDTKMIFSEVEQAQSLDAVVADDLSDTSDGPIKDIKKQELSLNGMKAVYVSGVSNAFPYNKVIIEHADGYIRVGLGGNGFLDGETLSDDVLSVLTSITL